MIKKYIWIDIEKRGVPLSLCQDITLQPRPGSVLRAQYGGL